jgi:hypothetical protein
MTLRGAKQATPVQYRGELYVYIESYEIAV